MCISHRGQKELKFIKRMQLLKTRTTTKQKSGVSEPMGQSANRLSKIFSYQKKPGPLKPGVQDWQSFQQIMAGIEAKVSFSNGFDYSNLPLQIVKPSPRPDLTKICMQKMYFAYYKKNHAKIVSLTGFLLLAQLYYATNHFVNLGIWDQDSD